MPAAEAHIKWGSAASADVVLPAEDVLCVEALARQMRRGTAAPAGDVTYGDDGDEECKGDAGPSVASCTVREAVESWGWTRADSDVSSGGGDASAGATVARSARPVPQVLDDAALDAMAAALVGGSTGGRAPAASHASRGVGGSADGGPSRPSPRAGGGTPAAAPRGTAGGDGALPRWMQLGRK